MGSDELNAFSMITFASTFLVVSIWVWFSGCQFDHDIERARVSSSLQEKEDWINAVGKAIVRHSRR